MVAAYLKVGERHLYERSQVTVSFFAFVGLF